jgi:hypothetical protein
MVCTARRPTAMTRRSPLHSGRRRIGDISVVIMVAGYAKATIMVVGYANSGHQVGKDSHEEWLSQYQEE